MVSVRPSGTLLLPFALVTHQSPSTNSMTNWWISRCFCSEKNRSRHRLPSLPTLHNVITTATIEDVAVTIITITMIHKGGITIMVMTKLFPTLSSQHPTMLSYVNIMKNLATQQSSATRFMATQTSLAILLLMLHKQWPLTRLHLHGSLILAHPTTLPMT